MMHIFRRFLVGCSYVFMSHSALMAQEAPKSLPNFKFQALNSNNPFNNTHIKPAKYIILSFYDPGCGHCQKMAIGLAKKIDSFRNSQVYFIAMNDREYIDGFINMYIPMLKNHPNVTFLRDPDVQFISTFNPTQYPSLYIYDGKTKRLIKHLDGVDEVDKIIPYIP